MNSSKRLLSVVAAIVVFTVVKLRVVTKIVKRCFKNEIEVF